MPKPWWLIFRPVVHRWCSEWWFSGFRWWRRLWGGHWERWYCDPCHGFLWFCNQHGTRPGACFGTPLCEDYDMPLTTNQIEAIRTLDWLLDETEVHRREGRSVAIAVALIRQALRYPHRSIAYLDHIATIPRRRQANLMEDLVRGIIARDPRLQNLSWEFHPMTFSVRLAEPFDWWPPEGMFNGLHVREVNRRPLPPSAYTSPERERIRAAEDAQIFEALDKIANEGFDPQAPTQRLSAWERLLQEDDD